MTIKKTNIFLAATINESTSRKERAISKKYLAVLTGIENRAFSPYQLELIEKELTLLNLGQPTKNKRKYMKQQLNQFIDYLETVHSLILEGHYAALGSKLGLVLGMAIGTHLFKENGGAATGLCFGLLIGYLIGKQMDRQAARQHQVLKIV
jgi:hypothetical protein